jgi:hypothetical protein
MSIGLAKLPEASERKKVKTLLGSKQARVE